MVRLSQFILALPLGLRSVSGAALGALEKREVIALGALHDGACNGAFTYNGPIFSGSCFNFAGAIYGAVFQNDGGETCTLKFWEDSNCHGKATVTSLEPYQDHGCVAVANKDGQFYLGSGAHSVLINCGS